MKYLFKRVFSNRRIRLFLFAIGLLSLLFTFSSPVDNSIQVHRSEASTLVTKNDPVSFNKQVRPILDKRCVVCHSCYDSPCQLKLSSVEGISRGASKERVYDPGRLSAVEPTRLFVDAKTEAEWRKKGFFSVTDNAATGESVMQRLLNLKQYHPQPLLGKLPSEFSFDIDRKQECVSVDGLDKYEAEFPLWGMPYAMPNLTKSEKDVLDQWLKGGAIFTDTTAPDYLSLSQIREWESFFNQASNKSQLVSRYLYEHLFHAHIYFRKSPVKQFFRLVRSTTSAPQAIDEIATPRPYDDPGTNKFYYRLLPYKPSIVVKNHIVYEFSNERLLRYKTLFTKPDYSVDKLPSYAPNIAANPFKVFADIPPDSRYRFLLDDARFFIEGFVKGPVCRGQIALSVIEDQFWIAFFDPDKNIFSSQPGFLNRMSDYLRIPSERKSHLNLAPIWTDYWQRQKKYMMTKQRYFENMNTHTLDHAVSYVWNGENKNPNAALTVFRHFDSATVEYGFVGESPETMWIIDYPLFERIHYLLVAGFNVYGNVGHQVSTRVFMDFLRMEGEDNFLAFLPISKRKSIRDKWYQGIRTELVELFKAPIDWLNVESVVGYQTDNVQEELYAYLKQRMAGILPQSDHINHCGNKSCAQQTDKNVKNKIDINMNKLAQIRGNDLHEFPEVSFIQVFTDDPDKNYIYSILRNKAYKNLVTMFSDERYRDQQDIDKDRLTVVDWLVGSYPNFFFRVHEKNLHKFIENCKTLESSQALNQLIDEFGIRRTNPLFWQSADWFQAQYKQQRPIASGIFDLSRYSNL